MTGNGWLPMRMATTMIRTSATNPPTDPPMIIIRSRDSPFGSDSILVVVDFGRHKLGDRSNLQSDL